MTAFFPKTVASYRPVRLMYEKKQSNLIDSAAYGE